MSAHESRPRVSEFFTLSGLFTASLLAATLLPGGSEVVLAAVLVHDPQLLWPALLSATLGNTLGGMSSYAIGRFIPSGAAHHRLPALVPRIQRFGAPILLLAWVPIVGDALCVAAGWLRLSALKASLWMLLGKFARYWVLAIAIV